MSNPELDFVLFESIKEQVDMCLFNTVTNKVTQKIAIINDPIRAVSEDNTYYVELHHTDDIHDKNPDSQMEVKVKICLISEMKYWSLFILERLGYIKLYGSNVAQEIIEMLIST